MSKETVLPTKEQYEAALTGIETMSRNGGLMHEFFSHVVTAAEYEDANGIEPNAIMRVFRIRTK